MKRLEWSNIHVKINDCTYKPGSVILTNISSQFPEFGLIQKILVVDEEITFDYHPLLTYGFDNHYFAFNVLETKNIENISHKTLVLRTPFLLYKHLNDSDEEELLVISRHVF